MLKLENICVSFKDRKIFDDARISAYENELTVIIGESGSGKTTLHDLLSLKEWYSCAYQYNHNHIHELSLREKEKFRKENIAIVSQFPKLIEKLSIRYHIQLCERTYGYQDDIEDIKSELEVNDLMDKYPNQLSGGEKVRVALLLALIQNASILLLDEPTSSLDDDFTLKVCQIIEKYKQGRIVIIFTHDHKIIEIADSLYEISKYQLNQKKESQIHEEEMTYQENHSRFSFIYYLLKMKKKLFSIFMVVALAISVAMAFFSMQYANYTSSQIAKTVKNLNSQIQIYKQVSTEDLDYILMNQQILADEINEIKSLKDIVDVWPLTIGFRDELLNTNKTDTYSIYKDGEKKVSKTIVFDETFGSELYTIHNFSYNEKKDYSQTKDVNYYFGDEEGVYIDAQMVNFLGLKSEELEGCEIEFPIYIPFMTVKGIGGYEFHEGNFDRQIHYRKVVKMKIKGITYRAIGLTYQIRQPVIYYPSSLLDEYKEEIVKYKSHLDITEIQGCSLGEYGPYMYLAEPTSNEKINSLIKEIEEIGFGCKSTYKIYSHGFADKIMSAGEQIRDTATVVLLVITIAYMAMKINSKREDHSLNLFFQERGFSLKERRILLLKKWGLEALVTLVITYTVLFIMRLYGEKYMDYVYQIQFSTLIYILIFIIVIQVIFPYIIEKRIKHDRTE